MNKKFDCLKGMTFDEKDVYDLLCMILSKWKFRQESHGCYCGMSYCTLEKLLKRLAIDDLSDIIKNKKKDTKDEV